MANINKDFGDRLRSLVEKKYKTISEAASDIGVSQQSLSNYCAGRIPRDKDLLVWLAEVFNVSVDYLLKGKKEEANVEPATFGKKRIPLLDWVQAGQWSSVNASPYPGVAAEYIDTDLNGGRLFALRVRGDSMEPDFLEGDLIIVNPDLQTDPGDYVIAKRDEEDEALFKQLKKADDVYLLRALNPKYEDIKMRKGIRIVGKVIRMRRERKL